MNSSYPSYVKVVLLDCKEGGMKFIAVRTSCEAAFVAASTSNLNGNKVSPRLHTKATTTATRLFGVRVKEFESTTDQFIRVVQFKAI